MTVASVETQEWSIPLSAVIPVGCRLEDLGGGAFTMHPEEDLAVLLVARADLPAELPTTSWLSVDASYEGATSKAINLMYWTDAAVPTPSFTVSFGTFPGLKATIAQSFHSLVTGDHVKRRPGRLISFAFGKGGRIDELTQVGISVVSIGVPTPVTFSNLRVLSAEPPYVVNGEPLVDELGQWAGKSWTAKTASAAELDAYLRAEAARAVPDLPEDRSSWGGFLEHRQSGTGWFRIAKVEDRWLFIDPDGHPFFSAGVDCVGAGIPCNVAGHEALFSWLPDRDGDFAQAWADRGEIDSLLDEGGAVDLFDFQLASAIRAFGPDWRPSWTKLMHRRLLEWSVNTAACWSDEQFARDTGMPYVAILDDFPTTRRPVFRDFPDVFSPEYAENCDAFAQQLHAYKESRNLIGYFMNNEPSWGYVGTLNLAEAVLESPDDLATKHRLIAWLRDRYRDALGAFNAAWCLDLGDWSDLSSPRLRARRLSSTAAEDLDAFSAIMVAEFVRVPAQALRAVDAHHLNLGMRWASAAFTDAWRFAGSEHLDVFSMNCYADDPHAALENARSILGDVPLLIGEFQHGSEESGLAAPGVRWTQTEALRGQAYRHYVERAAAHPQCIGAHYFCMNDDPVLGRFDGENFHLGLVDVCHRPYQDFVDQFADTNRGLADIVFGRRLASKALAPGTISSFPMSFT